MIQTNEIGEIWDKFDVLLGPDKQVQVITVGSILGAWSFPVLFDYDIPVDIKLWKEVVWNIEFIGIQMLLSVADQGPTNQALDRDLKVSPENVEVVNPFDPTRTTLMGHDSVHFVKNFRSFFLDKAKVRFSGNIEFSKNDLKQLMIKCKNLGICKLRDIHFTCNKSDRQNVRLATELWSETNALLLKDFFPDDVAKQHLSEFINVLDKSFNIFTSTGGDNSDFSKAEFDMYFDKQKEILEQLDWYLSNLKDIGNYQFPKAGKMMIKCILKLYDILSSYGVKSFKTSPLTTDDLEGGILINSVLKIFWFA